MLPLQGIPADDSVGGNGARANVPASAGAAAAASNAPVRASGGSAGAFPGLGGKRPTSRQILAMESMMPDTMTWSSSNVSDCRLNDVNDHIVSFVTTEA